MSESVQPLLWNGYALADAIQGHWLAPVYPEIVTLADELGQCIDAGIAVWRVSYSDEARAYHDSPASLADMSDAEFDRCSLAGYPEDVQRAALAVFRGIRSAEQHGGFKSLADAIRWHCIVDDDIPDRHLYALAAAIEAWWSMDSLAAWLNEGMAELGRIFSLFRNVEEADLLEWMGADPARWVAFECQNQQFTVDEWADRYPEKFLRWATKQRARQAKMALDEAEQREQAARSLGDAERLLMLADMADELSQAALDRLSLKAMQPYKEMAERLSSAGSEGGRHEPWGWAKPLWRQYAEATWQRKPARSCSAIVAAIIVKHSETGPDAWRPSRAQVNAGAKCGQPGKDTVTRAIQDLQPVAHRTKAGRPPKRADSTNPDNF